MEKIFNNPSFQKLRKKLRNNSTETETILWSRLRKRQLDGFKFCRQYGVGRYVLDFYCPEKRLAIEIDGAEHTEDAALKYDEERTKYLKTFGIRVLRFWNSDIFHRIDIVCDEIWKSLKERTPL